MANSFWLLPSRRPTPSSPPPVQSLDLPIEIRRVVYAEVIKSGAGIKRGYTRSRTIPDARTPCYLIDHGALNQVSRQVHQEFNDTLRFTLPREIRVDIRDLNFAPLRQFDVRRKYWRRYLNHGTRITPTLHFDSRTFHETFCWGMLRAMMLGPPPTNTHFDLSTKSPSVTRRPFNILSKRDSRNSNLDGEPPQNLSSHSPAGGLRRLRDILPEALCDYRYATPASC